MLDRIFSEHSEDLPLGFGNQCGYIFFLNGFLNALVRSAPWGGIASWSHKMGSM